MSNQEPVDPTDPIRRAYRRYLHLLKKCLIVLLLLTVVVLFAGVPHLQTTYHYSGRRPAGGIPIAEQKTDAWYFSITGWQHVRSGQYGQKGCPWLLLIPLKDCLR